MGRITDGPVKGVDVDQELDENTGDGEFESERGGFNGSNRRSAPGMEAFVILMALLAFGIHRDYGHGVKFAPRLKLKADKDGGKAQQANTLPNYSFNSRSLMLINLQLRRIAPLMPVLCRLPHRQMQMRAAAIPGARTSNKRKEPSPEELAMQRRLGGELAQTNQAATSNSPGAQPQDNETSEVVQHSLKT
ncbi:hypothetical protein [Shigella flexneri]|uniref:hypothetical protein n=1 Tax=Shigella flexneri TaxID=623 RepID=UPI0033B90E37